MARLALQHFNWIPLLCVILGISCRKEPDSLQPCFDRLEVVSIKDSQNPLSAMDEGEKRSLENMLRATLEDVLPACKTSSRSKASARFDIARRVVVDMGNQSVHLKGGLKFTLKGERARLGHFEENVETGGNVPVDTAQAKPVAIIAIESTSDLLGDLAKGYRDRLLLWRASPTQLHITLTEGALESRLEAIEVVGARGLRSEIPILLKLLTDEDERLRDASLGALLLLRAREAVPVLTKSREMKDGREMQKILDALASLGGEEAESYLSFVAESHDSGPIRDLARKALVRLVLLKKVSATQ